VGGGGGGFQSTFGSRGSSASACDTNRRDPIGESFNAADTSAFVRDPAIVAIRRAITADSSGWPASITDNNASGDGDSNIRLCRLPLTQTFGRVVIHRP